MVKFLLVTSKNQGHGQGSPGYRQKSRSWSRFSWLEVKVKVMVKVLLVRGKVKVMVKVLLVRGKSQGHGQGSPG
jgi:hypothetical protein